MTLVWIFIATWIIAFSILLAAFKIIDIFRGVESKTVVVPKMVIKIEDGVADTTYYYKFK